MSQELDLTCKICGAPISVSGARKSGRCKACALKARSEQAKARREAAEREHPHFCVICGKYIEWTYGRKSQNVQTCSRHCQMLMVQAKLKETPEHLEERLIDYIKQQKRYVSLKELREVFHISDKLLYSRHLSCPELNRKAGNYFPVNDKTEEQVREEYIDLIRKNKSIRLQEAARAIGVSGDYILSLGIKPSELRKELGLSNSHCRTKEETEKLIVDWLKEQPVYCSATQIREALHLDHKSSIQNFGFDIKELNAKAGHKPVYQSYYEDMALHLLIERGFKIETQKTFPDCVMRSRLRFDFWLVDYEVLIEVDGGQHTKPLFGEDSYRRIIKSDAIKKAFVESHHIPLYRIDAAPARTFKERFQELMDTISGLPRVNEEVHTDSNCGELPPGNAEDNPQPSLEDEPWDMQPDLGF